jgi:lysyl-tRNA synthetase class 2
MRMTEDMISSAALDALGTTVVEIRGETVDLAPPWPRIPLGEAIGEACGTNPLTSAREPEVLRAVLERDGVDTSRDGGWAALVDHMLSHYVEPKLIRPTFLIDYPVELSPLSRRRPDDPFTVERFEAFCGGMEIANGYSELNDPAEQRERFVEQHAAGRGSDDATHPIDEDYVTALEYGMPPTGGLGVGVDRCVMILTGTTSIREVVLFPALRDRPPGQPNV